MLFILVLILLLLGAAVVGSIYSNFLVFYSNFSESENYHRAYYTSISALERGELVVKQRQPGYIGSGGFILGQGTGSTYNSDGNSDKTLDGFSYLGENTDTSSVFWTINSRTTRIPAEGKGDIEWMLAASDSSGYNMMDYENAEVFLLYYDDSSGHPYENGDISRSSPSKIEGQIRLPKYLKDQFGELDTNSKVLLKEDLPKNDAIVDRQIRGKYLKGGNKIPYTIYSTQELYSSNNGRIVDDKLDSVFREGDINKPLDFKFGSDKRSPNNDHTRGRDISKPTIISQSEESIISEINTNKFQEIFTNTLFSNTQLRFSLLNLLEGYSGDKKNVYPFLEYYVDFDGKIVPDKYYTIDAEGNFKDYQVNLIIKKPTVKESILGSFTSIF